MCKGKEERDMRTAVNKLSERNVPRKPKNNRKNLLSSATDETIKITNYITKKQRGLGNLTY